MFGNLVKRVKFNMDTGVVDPTLTFRNSFPGAVKFVAVLAQGSARDFSPRRHKFTI